MRNTNIFYRFFHGFIDILLIGSKTKKLYNDFFKFKSRYQLEIKKQNTIFFYKNMSFSKNEALVEDSNRDQKITVSLTTYGWRIDYVHLVIESLGFQTIKADRIVLWLSKDEFSTDSIPIMLKRMEDRGLEIGYYEDIRSYKKIIPSLENYPNNLIITADDDFLYPEYMIEKLYRAYQKESDVIHCHRGHNILFTDKGHLKPYNNWELECLQFKSSFTIFPTSGGGTLYYPGCFSDEVTNKELFMELCPTADDIWLNAMTLKKGVQSKIINRTREWREDNIDINVSNDKGLYEINKHKNDEQIKKVFDYFNLWEVFKNQPY